jgi:hypothetical protein
MIGGINLTSRLALIAAAGLLAGSVSSAQAADLGGNCCADLEERIAELEATTARKGNRKVTLTVSGQVGEAIMWWDDGGEDNIYVGSHDYARTRFRFTGTGKISEDLSAGYLLEIGVRTSRFNRNTQNTDDGAASALDIRHSNWWLQSKSLGKVTVGQGSQATDGITEINLSNTAGLGFVQLPDFLASNGSGWLFRNSTTGGLGALSWGHLFPGNGASGQIGEGDRWNVVRYDSPAVAGFVVSASWGEDDLWDVALRYAGEFNGVKLAAGIGYGSYTDSSNNVSERGCAIVAGNQSCDMLGASLSIMHVPSGIYVAASYGRKDDDNKDARFGVNVQDSDDFYYIQAGIEQKWLPYGKTTIFADYHSYDIGALTNNAGTAALTVGAGFGALAADRIAGADLDAWGAGIVQNFEAAAMDIYLYYKHVEADVRVSPTGAGATTRLPTEDMQFLMTGAVIKF